MTKNVGTLDRMARAILGLVLLYLAFFSGLPPFDAALFGLGTTLVGLVMLATSTLRICPIYSLFGFKTCGDC